MKMFNEMSLVSIRKQLVKVGVEMTDEQFYSLTHSELKTIYRKSKKAYKLYTQVDAIINKKKAPTPAVPMGQVVFSDTPSSPEGEFRIGDKKKS
jgi:hypothetical protein